MLAPYENANKISPEENKNSLTELMIAVRNAQLETVNALLQSGTDVNKKSLIGWNALMIAAYHGNFDLVKKLVNCGADLSSRDLLGWDILIYAAHGKKLDLFVWLIEVKGLTLHANDIKAALLHAAASENIEMLLFILKNYGGLEIENENIIEMTENDYFYFDSVSVDLYLWCAKNIILLEKNSLEKLKIYYEKNDIAKLLLDKLKENNSVKSLECKIQEKYINEFLNVLSNENLEELIFAHYSLDPNMPQQIFTKLATISNSKLKMLSLADNKLEFSDAKALATFIEQNNTLENLDLQSCDLDQQSAVIILEAINKNPKKLKKLNLYFNKIGFNGCVSLANLLQNPHLSLQTLILSLNYNLGEGILSIANAMKKNRSVTQLYLASILFEKDEYVVEIANMISINTNLTKILLRSNDLSDYQGTLIINALIKNTSLTTVDLTALTSEGDNTQTIKALGKMLEYNAHLKKLILAHTNLLNSIEFLIQGLLKNHSLTKLDLSFSKIDNHAFINLIDTIAINKNVVDLSVHDITHEVILKLSRLLENNSMPFESLKIDTNEIDSTNYNCLFQSLESNSTLKSLIFFNRQNKKEIKQIRKTVGESLKYFNCTLQNINLNIKVGNEIDGLLVRNKKIASSDLDPGELKLMMDEIRKARFGEKNRFIHQPYSLRFRLAFFSQKLHGSIRPQVVTAIHTQDKPELIGSFLKR